MIFDVESIRKQFPALNVPTESGRLPIFFDNPAGTQVSQHVINAVTEYYTHMNANSGGAFATSQRNDEAVLQARKTVAKFLNASRYDEIVFGPNMTTLNFGLSRAIAQTLKPSDEIVLTRMDHDANVSPWLRIAADTGATVKWVELNLDDCTLDLNSLEAVLSENTRLVACVHASNAVGTINPVHQIGEMAHAVGALFVVDAVQSAPHIPIDVQAIGCDFLLCSAYKFFGPHIGIMWGKYDLLEKFPAYKVRPSKDKTPYRWETGTPSFETIHATAKAIDYIASLGDGDAHQGMRNLQAYEKNLVSHLIAGLKQIPGVHIAGITDPERFDQRVPTVVMTMDGYTPQQVAEYLAKQDIYVWDGDYYAIEIMAALGRSDHGMVRIGLAHYNTLAEVDQLLSALASLAK